MKYFVLGTALILAGCGTENDSSVNPPQDSTFGPIPTAPPETTAGLINETHCPLAENQPYLNPCGTFPETDELSGKGVGDFYCILDKTKGVVECEWEANPYQVVAHLSNAVGLIAVSEAEFCAITNLNQMWCWGHDMQAQLSQ